MPLLLYEHRMHLPDIAGATMQSALDSKHCSRKQENLIYLFEVGAP